MWGDIYVHGHFSSSTDTVVVPITRMLAPHVVTSLLFHFWCCAVCT